MARTLGITDKLLISAHELESGGKAPFSAEDLVVAAWKRYPYDFGLSGYLDERGRPSYPNSNRVYAEIMGSKPLRKQGLLRKVGTKMYRLTEAGRARAAAAAAANSSTDSGPQRLVIPREQTEFIRRLFESRAATKARSEKLDDVSFFEACGFWGISPQSGAKELSSRFAHLEAVITAARTALGDRSVARMGQGAVLYSIDDLKALLSVHEALQAQFSSEIEMILQRTDERK